MLCVNHLTKTDEQSKISNAHKSNIYQLYKKQLRSSLPFLRHFHLRNSIPSGMIPGPFYIFPPTYTHTADILFQHPSSI